MPSGIIIVDKPSGWTSQDVASKLRGVFRERRVGHGGTLDPMATGVLPVFVGRATRAAEYFESAEKEYEAALRLGVVTDTQDVEGRVLETRPAAPREALESVLPRFRGPIEQLPPMYSAVKIGGRKLYELARAGKDAERKARPVTIFALELLGERPGPDGTPDYLLRVRCSKGTYIRTLCHDIGAALGCGGCMAALRRTVAGRYALADAHPLAEIVAAADPSALLLPVDSLFSELPARTLPPDALERCRNGADIPLPGLTPGRYRVYGPDGGFLMVGRAENGALKTEKSFFEVT